MNILLDMGEVFLQAFFSALLLFILAKIMGFKQILQFTYFDYVVGITVGSIAASMSFEQDMPVYRPVIAMIVYTLIASIISILAMKNVRVRRFLNGAPILIMAQGKLLEKNMRTVKLDTNELLSQCRNAGYFSLNDLEYAVMEPNGMISFLPKSTARPLQTRDLGLSLKQELIKPSLIIDGQILYQNLTIVGFDEIWLEKQLEKLNIKDIKEVLFGTLDNDQQLIVYEKKVPCTKHTIFE